METNDIFEKLLSQIDIKDKDFSSINKDHIEVFGTEDEHSDRKNYPEKMYPIIACITFQHNNDRLFYDITGENDPGDRFYKKLNEQLDKSNNYETIMAYYIALCLGFVEEQEEEDIDRRKIYKAKCYNKLFKIDQDTANSFGLKKKCQDFNEKKIETFKLQPELNNNNRLLIVMPWLICFVVNWLICFVVIQWDFGMEFSWLVVAAFVVAFVLRLFFAWVLACWDWGFDWMLGLWFIGLVIVINLREFCKYLLITFINIV